MDDERKVGGRLFQTRGPETAKLRDPYVIVLVLGTIRSPRAGERKQRQSVLAATGTHIKANSAFHPYGVDKSSTNLPGWGEGGEVTSVGWQTILCDSIDKWRPVVLRRISLRTIRSFSFLSLHLCQKRHIL